LGSETKDRIVLKENMKITKEEVEHVAHLARLNLDEQELVLMTKQLDNILSYVEKLKELDTENIEPTTHAFSISNAFRDDTVKDSLSQKTALANCEKQNGECFVVPRII
jgi:aspartyl-tRNA(Asn)/glutamyl-tRNA(Gln) amidotransferase subunit C